MRTSDFLCLALALGGCGPAIAPATEGRRVASAVAHTRSARVVAPPPAPAGLLPAGACGFDPYLSDVCTDVPAFAVVTLRTTDARAAERALGRAPRFAGYPFVESFQRIPAADARVRGMAVFAGLFRDRHDADVLARAIGGEVIPLASIQDADKRHATVSGDWDAYEAGLLRVVETTTRTAAYAEDDLTRVEHDLDERLAVSWTKLPGQQARRAAALATLTPRCTVGTGRVFTASERDLYAFRRQYAPVTCDDGRRAWVPWRATRLESVVVAGGGALQVHQIILVECDVPTLETRAVGPAPAALGALTDEHCGD